MTDPNDETAPIMVDCMCPVCGKPTNYVKRADGPGQPTHPECWDRQSTWPLFCIKVGNGREYYGPYETRAEAMEKLGNFAIQETISRGEARVVRCRRSKVYVPDQYDWLIDAIKEAAGENPPDGEAWADWEDDLVAPVNADEADEALGEVLAGWARQHLRSKIFEVETEETEDG